MKYGVYKLELVKPKFDIKEYPGKFVMHVRTEDQAKTFCDYLHSLGKKWTNGNSYADHTYFHVYYSATCYNFNNDLYGTERVSYGAYTILEFEDFDWSDFMKTKFTKADLKNGDFVKLRDNSVGIALVDIGAITFGHQYIFISALHDDLTDKYGDNNDVMAVRRPNKPGNCIIDIFDRERGTLVYERKEVVEMTLEEVCEALGKEIKIVKNKEE